MNRRTQSKSSAHAKPVLSVVIPSYKPGRELSDCLGSVVNQNVDVSYEIVLVDSSPFPIGPRIRKSFPEVQVVHLNKRTLPGKARSIGAAMARGEVVFFTDTDCIADPDWMRLLWENVRDGYPVAGGSIVNGTPQSSIGSAEYLLEFNEINPGMKSRDVRALPSCNLAVEKRIFREVGFFPDFMKGEDTIFCDRVFMRGYKIRFDPSAKITHFNRTGFLLFLHNQTALGEGALETRKRTKRHGHFLIQWPLFVPLIPLTRTFLVAKRLLESDWRLFWRFVRLYPVILLGLIHYTWGFIRGPYRSGLSTELPDTRSS